MKKVWINKRFVDIDKAAVSVFDRGFMYADGVFETMRGYDGRVFKLDEHMDRLKRSLKTVKIRLPYSGPYLKDQIRRLADINHLRDFYVRLTVTRGQGRFGIDSKAPSKPCVVIIAKEFVPYPERMYKKGISAGIVSIRQNELSPLAGIKSLNFMNYIMARMEAKAGGSDEAIIANTKGRIAEAVTSNVFAVNANTLITPSIKCGALPGITRAVIIKISGKIGMRVVETSLSGRDLFGADEIFLTSSLAEVLPVTKLDGKLIGSGLPGRSTKLLHDIYRKEVLGR